MIELIKHHVGQWEFLGITTYALKPCLWQQRKPDTKEIITDNLVNWNEPNLSKNVKHKRGHTNKLECKNICIQELNFKYEKHIEDTVQHFDNSACIVFKFITNVQLGNWMPGCYTSNRSFLKIYIFTLIPLLQFWGMMVLSVLNMFAINFTVFCGVCSIFPYGFGGTRIIQPHIEILGGYKPCSSYLHIPNSFDVWFRYGKPMIDC